MAFPDKKEGKKGVQKYERVKIIHRDQWPTSFSEYVAQQPIHVRRILRDCDLSETTTQNAVSLICSGSLYGRTDGGLLNELGTFGFVWGKPRAVDKLLPIGKGHVPGASLIMSSPRTELCGIFAAITHLRLVVQFYHIVPPKNLFCHIHCDNKGALSRVGNKFYDGFCTTWRCCMHYDLEVAIRTCLLPLHISVSWQWVQGHALSSKQPHELSFPEILNEEADDLATAARQVPILTQQDDDHWPEQTVSIIGPRRRICGHLADELRCCCTASDLAWQDAVVDLHVEGLKHLSRLTHLQARGRQ
jgi:hypothetical protein